MAHEYKARLCISYAREIVIVQLWTQAVVGAGLSFEYGIRWYVQEACYTDATRLVLSLLDQGVTVAGFEYFQVATM